VPIAAPSANRSEEVSPTLAAHVLESLGQNVELILDGGPTAVGLESTVLDVSGETPVLLRPGAITPSQIAEVCGAMPVRPRKADGPLRSPGQQTRHYAPRARLIITDDPWSRAATHRGSAVIIARSASPQPLLPHVHEYVLPEAPKAYSSRIYAILRAADNALKGTDEPILFVESVPDGEEWMAVRDRLARAGA
jgi:L-threonylcarbamoyladenylate synthase